MDHQIRHTGFRSLHRSLSQHVMFTNPRKWQPEILVFFADDTSCTSLLLPIILRSEVHVVEGISIRILQWPTCPVLLQSVKWIEEFCRVHEVQ